MQAVCCSEEPENCRGRPVVAATGGQSGTGSAQSLADAVSGRESFSGGRLRLPRVRAVQALCSGLPLRAIAECVSRDRTVDDDGTELDSIKIAFVFQAPSGPPIRGDLIGPLRQAEFASWPEQGARFPMAVLYFGPDDYCVL